MAIDPTRFRPALYAAFVLVLPFGPFLPNLFMGLILALGLWHFFQRPRRFSRAGALRFFSINGFVFFHFISLAWSTDVASGLNKALLLGLVPGLYLALGILEKPTWKEAGRLIGYLAISVAALSLLSFAAAFCQNGWSMGSFYQENLATALIGFHYLGFSLYVGTASVLLLYLWVFRPEALPAWIRLWVPAICAVLVITLLMLGSRTSIGVTFLVVAGLLLLGRKRLGPAVRWLLVGLFGVSVLVLVLNRALMEKFREAINYGNQYEVTEVWGGRGFRELIWDCAWHTLSENPWIGVGYGDQQQVMNRCYREHRYQPLLLKGNNFNAHNLFLQTGIATGAVGVLLLLLAIGYPLVLLRGKKAGLYYIFILMIFLTGLTESHFNRNAIVLLFAFFNSFLLYLHLNDEGTSNT